MADERVLAAADNNARWCDLVCRSHGLPTRFEPSYWLTRHRSPRFYPDLVTLRPGGDLTAAWLLLDAGPGCSVKDSFADQDLGRHGFVILFEAEWISHPPPSTAASRPPRWSAVDEPDQLERWAQAHGGGSTFAATLLSDPDVRVLVRTDGDELVAGAVANRSGQVVGVSNVFSPGQPVLDTWSELVDVVATRFPGRPLVGYEQGPDLDAARAAGFTAIGPLRVWIRQ